MNNKQNNQVTKVEAQVNTLNDEVKNLVKEIRETTIITNARQTIMYNNDQIEKKYGYYEDDKQKILVDIHCPHLGCILQYNKSILTTEFIILCMIKKLYKYINKH